MRDDDEISNLGRLLYGRIPRDFGSYAIIGRRNVGKSTYAIKATKEALQRCGLSEEEAWEKALNSVCFSIPEVVDCLRDALRVKKETGKKLEVFIWDDLRVHGSGSKYFTEFRLVEQLRGLFDTIKTIVNNVILTSPSMVGVLGFLKTYDDYEIRIHHPSNLGERKRLAKGYQWNTNPSGQRRIYKKFRDIYVCRLPTDIYIRYMHRRDDATEKALFGVQKMYEETEMELKHKIEREY
jgi:hypothetical protein